MAKSTKSISSAKLRESSSELYFIWAVFAVVFTLDYLRMYLMTPIGDETFYVGSALLTSIGARPFFHEIFLQQTASLLYEPLVAIYYFIFGKFAIMLFVRHLFIACLLMTSAIVYRFCRKSLSRTASMALALTILTGVNPCLPTLGYNNMGAMFFGCFSILTLRAVDERSKKLLLWSGFFAFLCMASYPTLVSGVIALYAFIGLFCWRMRRPFLRYFLYSWTLTTVIMLSYIGTLVFRFTWENIWFSYEYMTHLVEGGPIWPKLSYGWALLMGFSPWAWLLFPILAAWLLCWRKFQLNWIYFVVLLGLFMAMEIRPKPEDGIWTPAFMLLTAGFGSIVMIDALRKDLHGHWRMAALWGAGLFAVPFLCWASGMTYYVTNNAALYSFFAVLVVCAGKSRKADYALFIIPFCLLYQQWEPNFRDDLNHVTNLSKVIDWGAYAGSVTYAEEYNFLRQMQDDLDATAQNANSILFYDNFPAGYMMSDLFPLTRGWIIHPLPYTARVRGFYREFYSDPKNRPDVVVRFTALFSRLGPIDQTPTKWLPYKDVFWYYLPEETGEYTVILNRPPYYSVYKKKSLL